MLLEKHPHYDKIPIRVQNALCQRGIDTLKDLDFKMINPTDLFYIKNFGRKSFLSLEQWYKEYRHKNVNNDIHANLIKLLLEAYSTYNDEWYKEKVNELSAKINKV